MALGIEPNSIAPQLIQNAGQSQVQLIRQVGQQISGHLTEMQTKRDLAGLAQSLQGANVQSNEFPLQLAQIASQHPMAVRDERGQMLMGILGKAHGAWQASEQDARNFNQQMALQGFRSRAAATAAEKAAAERASRPVSVFGVGLVDPVTGETIVPEGSRGGSSGPKTLSPGSILVDPSGKKIAENPKLPTASASESRMARKNRIDLLMRQDTGLRSEISERIRRRDALSKQRMEITDKTDPNAAYLDSTVEEIQKEVKTLRDQRLALQKQIEEIESSPVGEVSVTVEPELGVAPPNAAPVGVLPALGEIPTVMTIEEARKLPPGTQFKSPDGKIRVR